MNVDLIRENLEVQIANNIEVLEQRKIHQSLESFRSLHESPRTGRKVQASLRFESHRQDRIIQSKIEFMNHL